MGSDKMNKFLKERRERIKKVESFRKNRIVKNFHKHKNDVTPDNNQYDQSDPSVQRKLQFYNQVFNQSNHQSKNNQKKTKQMTPEAQVDLSQHKLQKLKEKKKKFIKKMSQQKTKKGQPVMRNYIKYALTKIEQTLEKEKNEKRTKQREQKLEKNRKRSPQQF